MIYYSNDIWWADNTPLHILGYYVGRWNGKRIGRSKWAYGYPQIYNPKLWIKKRFCLFRVGFLD